MAADIATNCTLETGYDNTLMYINHRDDYLKMSLTTEKKYATIDNASFEFEKGGGRAILPADSNIKHRWCFGNNGRKKEELMDKQLWMSMFNMQGWNGFKQPSNGDIEDYCSSVWALTTTQTMRILDLGWQERKETTYQQGPELYDPVEVGTLPDPLPKPPWPPPWFHVAGINSSREKFKSTKSSDRARERQQSLHFPCNYSIWGEDYPPSHNKYNSGYCYTIAVPLYGSINVVSAYGSSSDKKFRLPPPPWLSRRRPETTRFRQGFRFRQIQIRISQCQPCSTASLADSAWSLASHNTTRKQFNMMNNNTIDASGGGTGKRGLDAVQEKATNNLVVTPNQQRRKTAEGEPMELEDSDSDVEATQPTNFDKAVEKQATKPAASSWKKVSKKGEKTKQTSFAAAAVSRVQEMVTETETIVVKAPRTQQKSVVQDYAGIMKTVYQGYVDVLGVGKVCFRAVDEHIAVVYKGNNMGLDDFQLSEMFVASETMWKAKQAPNNTGMDALFDVKQGSKKEWMELVLVLGHSGIAWGDYGSIRSKLLAKHIRITVKQTPGLHSNSNVVILQGATRLPLGAAS